MLVDKNKPGQLGRLAWTAASRCDLSAVAMDDIGGLNNPLRRRETGTCWRWVFWVGRRSYDILVGRATDTVWVNGHSAAAGEKTLPSYWSLLINGYYSYGEFSTAASAMQSLVEHVRDFDDDIAFQGVAIAEWDSDYAKKRQKSYNKDYRPDPYLCPADMCRVKPDFVQTEWWCDSCGALPEMVDLTAWDEGIGTPLCLECETQLRLHWAFVPRQA